jgi:UDP-3-O-[3-hydroxymyristoyl] glucosamine N-acyltransferase
MLNTLVGGQSFPLLFAGGVKIGYRCEILTNAVIQRPYQAFYTNIGDDCKISVKAVVGHGVSIGRGTMVAGNAQISGDVVIGEEVWIGPSVTIASAVSVGDRAQVKLGSVVVSDVQPGQHVSGNFAVDHVRQLRFHGRLRSGQF